jgi:hypothetical protein
MRTRTVQPPSHAQTPPLGPQSEPPTDPSSVHQQAASAKKKPVLNGVRAILISAAMGSAAWFLLWEIAKFLLRKR